MVTRKPPKMAAPVTTPAFMANDDSLNVSSKYTGVNRIWEAGQRCQRWSKAGIVDGDRNYSCSNSDCDERKVYLRSWSHFQRGNLSVS
jgi:hypothetical protein